MPARSSDRPQALSVAGRAASFACEKNSPATQLGEVCARYAGMSIQSPVEQRLDQLRQNWRDELVKAA
jgi:hypothetical protein